MEHLTAAGAYVWEWKQGVTVARFGPKTAETAREHGLEVHVMLEARTLAAFVNALAEHFGE